MLAGGQHQAARGVVSAGLDPDSALFPVAAFTTSAYLGTMTRFDDIAADFAFLDDWDERYKYLIDLGRSLAPYPEILRNDAHKVRGCASQVWLHAELIDEDGRRVIRFKGDSDAHIVKGLVALLIALYSGKTPAEVLKTDAKAALSPFDLDGHLTPQRSNGLASMIRRIGDIAAEAQ